MRKSTRIEFRLPVFVAVATGTGDISGLSDKEAADIEVFEHEVVKAHGAGHWDIPNIDENRDFSVFHDYFGSGAGDCVDCGYVVYEDEYTEEMSDIGDEPDYNDGMI